MAYGTPEGVAANARLYSDNGVWVDPVDEYEIRGTNPTLSTVEDWLEEVSAQMDNALQASWFVTPIDEDVSPTTYKAVTGYVQWVVSDMARKVNGENIDLSDYMKKMSDWVKNNEDSFVQDNVPQRPSPSQRRQANFRVIGNL